MNNGAYKIKPDFCQTKLKITFQFGFFLLLPKQKNDLTINCFFLTNFRLSVNEQQNVTGVYSPTHDPEGCIEEKV